MANKPDDKIVRIDVVGEPRATWHDLKPKLLKALNDFLDKEINSQGGATIGDELSNGAAGLLDNLKARLKKPVLENNRIEADILKTYAECELAGAQTRKVNAEADALEFENARKKLKMVLSLTKGLLLCESDDDAIVFSRQIDAMLVTLREHESDREADDRPQIQST